MRSHCAALFVVVVSFLAHAVPTTNSNGSVMTPNSELSRNQQVATDVSGLLSSESDPTVGLTNGTIHVKGEKITPLTEHQSLEPATNYTDSATNALRLCDGVARPLPKYLHLFETDDVFPEDAAWYYSHAGGSYGACSVRSYKGTVERNYDWKIDSTAEFVVRTSAAPGRFASVGVANVGTNLTEEFVSSGRRSRFYRCLPGHMLDGINSKGVVCCINVVNGDPHKSGWGTNEIESAIHPLAAVRWVLDNATDAQSAATFLAEHIRFPEGWDQNFHYVVSDMLPQGPPKTYIVENGDKRYYPTNVRTVMTNYPVLGRDNTGPGTERAEILRRAGSDISDAWFTKCYLRSTSPMWVSDLKDFLDVTNELFDAWAEHGKEWFRDKTFDGEPLWQTVHTSVYDLRSLSMKVSVQESGEWTTFSIYGGTTAGIGALGSNGDQVLTGADYGLTVTDTSGYKSVMCSPSGVFLWEDRYEGTYQIGLYPAEYEQLPCIAGYDHWPDEDIERTYLLEIPAKEGTIATIEDIKDATGDYAAVSNAAMSAISTVTNADANLIYTITGESYPPRFYFTPVGAIDPTED